MTVRLLLLLVAGCGTSDGDKCDRQWDCKSHVCAFGHCSSGEIGAPCDDRYQCKESSTCVNYRCAERPREGEACGSLSVCAGSLECLGDRCVNQATAAEIRRKEKAIEEARLLKASGVTDTRPVETPIHPRGSGSPVRVATTTARATLFAACRDDERLIGGGCRYTEGGKRGLIGSYPSAYGDRDTVGARWNCEGDYVEIVAYALCEKLP